MSDELNFVEVDAQKLNNKLITDFEQAYGETLYPGDERRIFLQQIAQIIVGLKNDINDTGKQNLIKYARGEILDAIGERTGTIRLLAQKAKTTLEFVLSQAQTTNITIPQGTRATPDGELYFETTEDLIIISGQTAGKVIAEAMEPGEKYNGFAAGQIKSLVDPMAYVASVSNIDTSYGGSDTESDDDYRQRLIQAPSKFSTAGPTDAYIYWAKTADTNIADVKVLSPAAGEVKIVVMMKNGELPTQSVLDAVKEACSNRKRRPLTDLVTVVSPVIVPYDINLTYYISQERGAEEAVIREAIEDAGGALEQYQTWQSSQLGRDINPDYLRQLMLNAGAYRIDITSPVFTEVADDEVALIGTINVSYGGLI